MGGRAGFELVQREERDSAQPFFLEVTDRIRRDLVVVADHELELVACGDIQRGRVFCRGFPQFGDDAVYSFHGRDRLDSPAPGLAPGLLGCLEPDRVLLVLADLRAEALEGRALGKEEAFQFREVAVQLLLFVEQPGNILLAVPELRLFCPILLVQLVEQAGEAFELGRAHPALLYEHVLLVEDARALPLLLFNLPEEGEELLAGALGVLAVLSEPGLDLFELCPGRGDLHGDVGPVDSQRADLVGALGHPGFRTLGIHIYPVDGLEVPFLLPAQAHISLLGELDPALGFFKFCDQLEIVRTALFVDEVVDILQVGFHVRELVLLEAAVGCDAGELDPVLFGRLCESPELLFPVVELGRGAAVLEIGELLLPFLVLEGMPPLPLQLVRPPCQLDEEELFPLYPFPHDVELGERLLLLGIELGYPGDLVDDLPPLEVAHLHDAGDVALHHDIVAMGLDPVFCEVIYDVALLAEPLVEIVVAVIPVPGPLDPPADPRPVRELERDLGGVPAGVQVDEVRQFLRPEVAGTRQGKDEKDGIDDVAFARTVGPRYDSEAL